jgi:hypothetical protein
MSEKIEEKHQEKLITHFHENFPVLYHGTTSIEPVDNILTLKGAFSISSRKIYASHDRRVAANYAAIVKDHPHMSGALTGIDGPLHFVVIDNKKDYLSTLANKRKLLLSFSNETFTAIPFGINTVAEWQSKDDAVLEVKEIHEYHHLNDILADGAQVFFTRGTINHEDVRQIYRNSQRPNSTIKYMVEQSKLEWANLERGISPALEFQKG